MGLRLVLKSPLWLAPVVYLAPLKPIIIIIIYYRKHANWSTETIVLLAVLQTFA